MTIAHNATDITITGTETGAALRSYLTTNGIELVKDNDIVFTTRNLVIGAGTLTDSNSCYMFTGTTKFQPNEANGSIVNFTNVIIKFNGSGRGFYANCPGGELNWTNVTYTIYTTGGRTDFFDAATKPNLTGVFNNVALTHDGSGVGHLLGTSGSPIVLNGVTLDINDGFVFEYTTLNDSTFPPNVLYAFIDAGNNYYNRLNWGNTNWNIARGGGNSEFFDPIKPSGWTGYSSVVTNVKEYFSHNLQAKDTSGANVQGASVRLRNNTLSTNVYDVTTGSDGKIAEQKVLTYNGAVPAYYSNFTLGIWKYGKIIKSESRPFSTTGGPIDEVAVLISDTSVTEAVQATVQAYTQGDTAAKFYDLAHNYTIVNKAAAALVSRTDTTINAGAYNVVIDATAASVFSVSGSTITVKASTFTGNIITTGTVTLQNGAAIVGFIDDASGATTALRFA